MNRKTTLLAAVLFAAFFLAPAGSARAACPPNQMGLAQANSVASGSNPTGVVARDFNGDGILDIATVSSHTTHGNVAGEVLVRIGLGTGGVGNGTFGVAVSYPAGVSPFGLVAGDYTGDGILDLVVTNPGVNSVSLLRGLGTGGVGNGAFATPTPISAGGVPPHHIVTADFNHDGVLDLAVALNAGASMGVFIGQSTGGVANGTFAPIVFYPTIAAGTGIALADVNEDGILDILVTEYSAGDIGIFLGNGSGGFGNGTFQAASHVSTGPSPYDVAGVDVDGDGHKDLLVGRDSNGGLWLYRGLGNGSFTTGTQLASGASMTPGIITDFDGDGIVDIAYTASTANRIGLLHGVGGGAFVTSALRPVPAFPVFSTSGDFNGDGAPDIVVSSYTSDSSSVILSQCLGLPASFRIDRIRDVPNDQGGKLWVTWPPQLQDAPGGTTANYRVWRRIPAALAAARPAASLHVTASAAGPIYWEAAAVLPAQNLPAYGYTAATAQDSLSGSNPYTAFFITAVTAGGTVLESTPVDSGYSVDNLSPNAPAMVQGQLVGSHAVLGWSANQETDLYGYRVHRGSDRFFVPSAGNLVGSPAGTAFTDPVSNAGFFYKVAAVDVHGNVGPFVLVEPSIATSVEVGLITFDVTPDGVTLTWYADAHAVPVASLERSVSGGEWQSIASGSPDGGGQLVFHDADVTMGVTYGYRLSWTTPTGERRSQAVNVTIPGLALALQGAWPNPAHAAQLAIRFTLTDGAPALLALYDVTGRRVLQREVGTLGAGAHVVDLKGTHLAPGLYLAKLAQHGQARVARVVLAP